MCIILLPLIMNIDECWVRVVQELIKTKIWYCILCHLSHSDDPMYSIFACHCALFCQNVQSASFLNVKTFWASSYKICLLVQFCFWSFAAIFHIIIYTDPPNTYSFCIMTNLIMGKTVPLELVYPPLSSVFNKLWNSVHAYNCHSCKQFFHHTWFPVK